MDVDHQLNLLPEAAALLAENNREEIKKEMQRLVSFMDKNPTEFQQNIDQYLNKYQADFGKNLPFTQLLCDNLTDTAHFYKEKKKKQNCDEKYPYHGRTAFRNLHLCSLLYNMQKHCAICKTTLDKVGRGSLYLSSDKQRQRREQVACQEVYRKQPADERRRVSDKANTSRSFTPK